jgi:glycerophosphoryl diester phosphodiesterase
MSAPPDGPSPVRIQLGARRERIGVLIGLLLVIGAGLALGGFVLPEAVRGRVQIMAHRGASAYAPENTLASFKLAVEQHADWLEMDVQETSDGQLIVIHDLTVDRTTNGRGNVRNFTFEQIRQLDAGSWFDPKFAGERVPTFEEVVAYARDAGVQIFPETKDPRFSPGIEEKMAAIIAAYGYEDHTIVQSFDGASLERMRKIDPKLRLAALYTASTPLKGDPPASAEIVGPPWEMIAGDLSLVRDAHAAGRQVVVWTADTQPSIQMMLDARVDGIITGRPDLARSLLDGR